MTEDLRRKIQRSIRLNEEEADRFDGLVGYRGMFDFAELVRAGLQLLLEAEQDDFAARGTTGAKYRKTKPKGGKAT